MPLASHSVPTAEDDRQAEPSDLATAPTLPDGTRIVTLPVAPTTEIPPVTATEPHAPAPVKR
jgi:hypothetical protein